MTPRPRKKVRHYCPKRATESQALYEAEKAFSHEPGFAGCDFLIANDDHLDPCRILIAPPEFPLDKANALARAFAAGGFWDGEDSEQAERLAGEWSDYMIAAVGRLYCG